ncbi:uracil-DNA glycosylase-like protein [Flagelloscypha sp. PMI_526]|nr:uracil-DNA glycosylase-like protein [Flagelloscypha sp. PMI_526]
MSSPPKPQPSNAMAGYIGPQKRQRTLNDMFGGKPPAAVGPPAKKAKVVPKGGSNSSLTFHITKLNSIPFSMASFEASLTEEEQNLLALEIETFGKSWFKVLHPEFKKQYFISLKRFLWNLGVKGVDSPKQTKVYPPARHIYSWTATPLGKVRCVIIGQDPYHGPGQAHGMCFSVQRGTAIPPSLQNIYKEIRANYPEFVIPKHGDLSVWAQNGVLLLNTCLTVNAHQAGSHQDKGWEQFTEAVINAVDKYGGANLPRAGGGAATGVGQGVAILAWGAHAAKRVAKLDKKKHLILTSAHPSPLSVHRGFFGNKHFSLANEWLEQKYGPTGKVDWCNLEPKPVEDETPTPSQSQEQDARSSPVPDPEDGDVAAA